MNNKLITSLDELVIGEKYYIDGNGWFYDAVTEEPGYTRAHVVFQGTGVFYVTMGPMDSKVPAAVFEVAIDGVYRDVWFPLESIVGTVEKESTEPRESGESPEAKLAQIRELLEDLKNWTKDPPDAEVCSVCDKPPIRRYIETVDQNWKGLRAWIDRITEVLERKSV